MSNVKKTIQGNSPNFIHMIDSWININVRVKFLDGYLESSGLKQLG